MVMLLVINIFVSSFNDVDPSHMILVDCCVLCWQLCCPIAAVWRRRTPLAIEFDCISPSFFIYHRNRCLRTSSRQISFEFLLVKNCPWTKLKTWHRFYTELQVGIRSCILSRDIFWPKEIQKKFGGNWFLNPGFYGRHTQHNSANPKSNHILSHHPLPMYGGRRLCHMVAHIYCRGVDGSWWSSKTRKKN